MANHQDTISGHSSEDTTHGHGGASHGSVKEYVTGLILSIVWRPNIRHHFIMFSCSSICATSVLLAHEWLFRTNLEYDFRGVYCFGSLNCCIGFDLDHEPLKSQYATRPLTL